MSSSRQAGESKGRGHRQKRASFKLQSIEDDNQEVPGLTSPSPRLLTSTTSHFHVMSIFSEQKFAIYNWPYPPPKSFPSLSPEHRRWKEEIDSTGSDISEFGDGADDDWCDFAGNEDIYPGGTYGFMRAVARTFVNRAKRAFRRGSTWAEFEEAERALDSEAAVKVERNIRRRAWLRDEALDNTVRLAVLDQLRGRLCREIWLEEFPQTARAYDSGVEGLAVGIGMKESKSKLKVK